MVISHSNLLFFFPEYCLSQRDADSAWFLLCNFPQIVDIGLPAEALSLLMTYTGLVHSASGRKDSLVGLTTVMEQLKDAKGWFTEKALNDAEQMAKASQDKQLMELIKHIQQKRGRW
jgi:hypothetical protein